MPKLLQLHLIVFLLAATGVIGRVIDLPAPTLVVWRTALAALGAGLWVVFVHRRPLRAPRRGLFAMLGVGLIIGLHWMCFFGSIRLSNVSIALAGFATTSLFTSFTEAWFERRKVNRFEFFIGLPVVGGILLIAGGARGYLPGLGLAIVAAFLAAVFPVLNRSLVRGHDPLVIVGWEMTAACGFSLAVVPWFGGYEAMVSISAAQFGWLLVLALLCTVFAHGMHVHLLRSLSAYTSNLAINFEPVYGMLMAAWIFHEYESLTPAFYTGALIIVAANLLHPLVLKLRSSETPKS
jgi:drug/metabolite transporter (DMT)-like permease